ncbi:MAG: ASCH domain-containing protein [Chloroflexota bacterium]
MTDNDAIPAFWQGYLDTLPADHPHQQASYTAWGFGDSPQMADELGKLVVEGRKTATASALHAYQNTDEPAPEPGDISIILDGTETPMCIIQTTDIVIRPFNEVTADFARAEGEGDLSLDYWREAHTAFFTREAEQLNLTFSETMSVVCETFKVIYTR